MSYASMASETRRRDFGRLTENAHQMHGYKKKKETSEARIAADGNGFRLTRLTSTPT